MVSVIRRRSIIAVAAAAPAWSFAGARAQGKTGLGRLSRRGADLRGPVRRPGARLLQGRGLRLQADPGRQRREDARDHGLAPGRLRHRRHPARAAAQQERPADAGAQHRRPARARRALRHSQGPLRPGHRHGAEGRRLEAAGRQARDLRCVLDRRHLASVVALLHGKDGPRRQGDLGADRQCRHHAGLAQDQADRRAVERDLGGDRSREERLGQGDLRAERREDLERRDRRARCR